LGRSASTLKNSARLHAEWGTVLDMFVFGKHFSVVQLCIFSGTAFDFCIFSGTAFLAF
jgi:hypothetical protein